MIPEATLTKPPSAELRPDQTDQDSLPPYDLLDAILDAHLVRGLDAAGAGRRRVRRRRRRATSSGACSRASTSAARWPPGLKITGKAFGPGRRYPDRPGG